MSWREVLARKNFWLLVGIYLPLVALSGAAVQNIAPYAASHGLGQRTAAALLSLLSAMHIVATLLLGLLSDRFGNRLPFIGLAALMVVGTLLLALGSDLPVIVMGCALTGLERRVHAACRRDRRRVRGRKAWGARSGCA